MRSYFFVRRDFLFSLILHPQELCSVQNSVARMLMCSSASKFRADIAQLDNLLTDRKSCSKCTPCMYNVTTMVCSSLHVPASPRSGVLATFRCQPQFGGQLASKFCSRWTSQRGLRDLDASDNLQKLLNMFSVAASTAHASNEHARIIMRYLDTRQACSHPLIREATK